jgi:tRNA A58 N-methylase Trm61
VRLGVLDVGSNTVHLLVVDARQPWRTLADLTMAMRRKGDRIDHVFLPCIETVKFCKRCRVPKTHGAVLAGG